MMFSRIGRSISQFSRSRNVLSGENGGRSQILIDSSSVCESRYAIRKVADNDDKFGVVLKRYLGSLAANKYQRNGSSVLSDTNSVLANPRNRRFFHSLQKKKKKESSIKQNVTFIIIFASVMYGTWYDFSVTLDDTNSRLERFMSLREREDKLVEEMPREWKMKLAEEAK